MLPATSATPSSPGQRRFMGSTGAWWARNVTGTGPWCQSGVPDGRRRDQTPASRCTPAVRSGPGPTGRHTAGVSTPALPADDRPFDHTPVTTDDLPPTPTRDRNIPATAWIEAPPALLAIGDDLAPVSGNPPLIAYKRRLGGWLLWRAGPARGADARYAAVDAGDLNRMFTFRLHPDGSGTGTGPSGANHTRFRAWKEDLRDHPTA